MKRYYNPQQLNYRYKELRLQHSFTCAQIAELLNIDESEYISYENDKPYDMPLDKFIQLADLYNVTSGYLIGCTDNPYEP